MLGFVDIVPFLKEHFGFYRHCSIFESNILGFVNCEFAFTVYLFKLAPVLGLLIEGELSYN